MAKKTKSKKWDGVEAFGPFTLSPAAENKLAVPYFELIQVPGGVLKGEFVCGTEFSITFYTYDKNGTKYLVNVSKA